MNTALKELWSFCTGTHGARDEMLDALSNQDLAFTPGGTNLTLGALIDEMANVEASYAESFKTKKQHFRFHDRATAAGSGAGSAAGSASGGGANSGAAHGSASGVASSAASGAGRDVASLKRRFAEIDRNFDAALESITDTEVTEMRIDRGFPISAEFQIQVYLQALLVFLGKASIFFRAMGRPVPKKIEEWLW